MTTDWTPSRPTSKANRALTTAPRHHPNSDTVAEPTGGGAAECRDHRYGHHRHNPVRHAATGPPPPLMSVSSPSTVSAERRPRPLMKGTTHV
jgi:hypothetical protein